MDEVSGQVLRTGANVSTIFTASKAYLNDEYWDIPISLRLMRKLATLTPWMEYTYNEAVKACIAHIEARIAAAKLYSEVYLSESSDERYRIPTREEHRWMSNLEDDY